MGKQTNSDPSELIKKLGSAARLVPHAAFEQPIRTAQDLANALGYPPERIAKTLLLHAKPNNAYIAVLLALPDRLALDIVAETLGIKSVGLASIEQLRKQLGTSPGAVSPFYLKEIPLHIDERLLKLPTIAVSAGVPGIDIEISPAALIEYTSAKTGRYRI